MTVEIIIQILLLGIALSMDAFAVSITDGLIYQDINKKKALFIALTFGVMQGLMPLIGYWLVELVEFLVNEGSSGSASKIMSLIVVWTAFGLLLFLGTKMLVEGILALKKKEEDKPVRLFSYKEVLFFGLATSIDALGSGVALHSGLSNNITIFIQHALIVEQINNIMSGNGTLTHHILYYTIIKILIILKMFDNVVDQNRIHFIRIIIMVFFFD